MVSLKWGPFFFQASLLFWNMKWAFYCVSCWLSIGTIITNRCPHAWIALTMWHQIDVSMYGYLGLLIIQSYCSFAGHLMEKIESENLLHRAFSVFLFNSKFELLLQVCGWILGSDKFPACMVWVQIWNLTRLFSGSFIVIL